MSTPSAPSIVRTVVPVIVGAIASYLVTLGVTLPEDVMAALSVIIMAAATSVYYIIVRWLEQKFPKVGILLGWAAVPESYTPARVRNSQGTEVVVEEVDSSLTDEGPQH